MLKINLQIFWVYGMQIVFWIIIQKYFCVVFIFSWVLWCHVSPVQAPVIGSLEFDTVLFSSVNIKSPALMQAQSALPSLNILERNGDVHNHMTDGIIFQPNLPYVCGTDVNLLKWKYLQLIEFPVFENFFDIKLRWVWLYMLLKSCWYKIGSNIIFWYDLLVITKKI